MDLPRQGASQPLRGSLAITIRAGLSFTRTVLPQLPSTRGDNREPARSRPSAVDESRPRPSARRGGVGVHAAWEPEAVPLPAERCAGAGRAVRVDVANGYRRHYRVLR